MRSVDRFRHDRDDRESPEGLDAGISEEFHIADLFGPITAAVERMMSAADEYRRMAEQCLRWAREAKTEEEQKAFLEMATNCSQRAAQEEGSLWVGTCALRR
jgi:hypothetical protein